MLDSAQGIHADHRRKEDSSNVWNGVFPNALDGKGERRLQTDLSAYASHRNLELVVTMSPFLTKMEGGKASIPSTSG